MPRTFAQIQPGLALGFGIPFAVGVVYRICVLFGWTLGTGFGLTWLVAELATIAALAVIVTSRERLTLGSVGYRSIESRDLRAGAALLGWMLGLSAIVSAVYLHSSAAGFGRICRRRLVVHPRRLRGFPLDPHAAGAGGPRGKPQLRKNWRRAATVSSGCAR